MTHSCKDEEERLREWLGGVNKEKVRVYFERKKPLFRRQREWEGLFFIVEGEKKRKEEWMTLFSALWSITYMCTSRDIRLGLREIIIISCKLVLLFSIVTRRGLSIVSKLGLIWRIIRVLCQFNLCTSRDTLVKNFGYLFDQLESYFVRLGHQLI